VLEAYFDNLAVEPVPEGSGWRRDHRPANAFSRPPRRRCSASICGRTSRQC
jgi:hypothetical protein